MYRVKNVEKPFGKGSVLFPLLSVVQINNADCGKENSSHSAKRTQDAHSWRHGLYVFCQIDQPEKQHGVSKHLPQPLSPLRSEILCYFALCIRQSAGGKPQRKQRSQQRPVAIYGKNHKHDYAGIPPPVCLDLFPDHKDQEAQEEEIQYPDLTVEDYQEMNHALYQVALSAGKSVVEIYAVHRDEGWENAGEQAVSGVIFWDNGADLLIAAPARIVKDAEALKATFSDNTTYNATLKKQDRNLGLAIIAIKRSDLSDSTRNQIQTAMLGNSNAVNRGDGVIVLGEQFGYAGGVGYGIISSTRNYRTVADGQYRLLDTDIAGSEKGSGILFNTAGEVIGICDQSELQRDGNLVSAYAISDIKEEIELLANGQGVPYIGVHGVVVTEKLAGEQGIPKGIYVREVEADSPAMQAGIQNGDVITEINKTDITGIAGLHKQIAEAGTGTQIRIKGQRRGADGYVDVTFDVTVGSKE